MLIIATLASYSTEREERMAKDLAIAGFHGIPKAFVRHGQWNLLNKRYRTAVAGWKAGRPSSLSRRSKSESATGDRART